jgi:tripartite-type tricarboxylate transporter receptor subunit TctC
MSEVVPGYVGELWVGFFAPAGVPKAIRHRLETEIQAAVSAPEVLEKFNGFWASNGSTVGSTNSAAC